MLSGCIEDYTPEVKSSKTQFLVVDGFINTQGPTTIKLSRSANLAQTGGPVVERLAQVSIEDAAGNRTPLKETVPGTYVSADQQLVPGRNYRLTIKTGAGRQYVSAFTAAKVTPPIDAITWKASDAGVQLYVNTHDPAGATGYYRWIYDETWFFLSAYNSELEYVDGEIRPRKDNIYECWGTENPEIIQVGTTTGLTQDAVTDFPLTRVPRNSIKLRFRYSLRARQYALSQEEYKYWETLKKNTETLGTPFDPLPSQVQGNVHCLQDATEPVLGFVGATSLVEKRLFVNNNELPADWTFLDSNYLGCQYLADTTLLTKDEIFGYFSFIKRTPIAYVRGKTSFSGSTTDCVDCRVHGTNVKPSFW
ncbi:uncharacterized protein DUF4249 [Hymenobacter chitinivorans DSM 11115]|uniref:Uncharacterized protein DUF4249 n=2 Tax=Hymenobacter chitinivorans TaxID=89969 RepID=A0A2M9B5G9_9BACT|nr:uncharacterized protein DUF4249 [Hymenobacter chitinivorans DSM 11115]